MDVEHGATIGNKLILFMLDEIVGDEHTLANRKRDLLNTTCLGINMRPDCM